MTSRRARVLVIDDRPQMRRSIKVVLSSEGYDVVVASSGEEGLHEFDRRRPDLVLLDLMLPGIDGLTVCEQLRRRADTAIVILSARGEEEIKVRALNLGADDYLTKPFGTQELIARVRVALRHSARLPSETFECANLVVDVVKRTVSVGGKPISLTPREYDVLKFFVAHRDRVLTHDVVLREIWGNADISQAPSLRNTVRAIRQKIEVDAAHPRLIMTEPGIGYRLNSEPAGPPSGASKDRDEGDGTLPEDS